mmetsp:Transcript_2201/g.5009  ORF Transcript_2201/g.5009 Transcript_2201/m.5009 type:complete len:205 (+) Transcript_2201:699-1313(+)
MHVCRDMHAIHGRLPLISQHGLPVCIPSMYRIKAHAGTCRETDRQTDTCRWTPAISLRPSGHPPSLSGPSSTRRTVTPTTTRRDTTGIRKTITYLLPPIVPLYYTSLRSEASPMPASTNTPATMSHTTTCIMTRMTRLIFISPRCTLMHPPSGHQCCGANSRLIRGPRETAVLLSLPLPTPACFGEAMSTTTDDELPLLLLLLS